MRILKKTLQKLEYKKKYIYKLTFLYKILCFYIETLDLKELIFLLVSIAFGCGITQGKGALPIFCSSFVFKRLSVNIDPH